MTEDTIIWKMSQATGWEMIFISYISDKRLISKTYLKKKLESPEHQKNNPI